MAMPGRGERTSDLNRCGHRYQPNVDRPESAHRLMSGLFHRATITPPASAVIGCGALPGPTPRESQAARSLIARSSEEAAPEADDETRQSANDPPSNPIESE